MHRYISVYSLRFKLRSVRAEQFTAVCTVIRSCRQSSQVSVVDGWLGQWICGGISPKGFNNPGEFDGNKTSFGDIRNDPVSTHNRGATVFLPVEFSSRSTAPELWQVGKSKLCELLPAGIPPGKWTVHSDCWPGITATPSELHQPLPSRRFSSRLGRHREVPQSRPSVLTPAALYWGGGRRRAQAPGKDGIVTRGIVGRAIAPAVLCDGSFFEESL